MLPYTVMWTYPDCVPVVLYHMPARQDAAAAKADLAKREEDLIKLKSKHNIGDDD
jgi:pre-mRNA branch site protein p14